MNRKIIIILLLVILGIAFIIFLGINKERDNATTELDEANATKLQEISNCIGINLTTNISCRIYDSNKDNTVDILDLTAFTQNLSIKSG